jgi:hypothetical protein
MSEEIMDLIKRVIQEVGGEIMAEEGAYISATFTSPLLGFVDDVECRNDKANHTMHLRSVSRVGYSDFGANRKRVAVILNLFHKRVNTAHQEQFPTNTRPRQAVVDGLGQSGVSQDEKERDFAEEVGTR